MSQVQQIQDEVIKEVENKQQLIEIQGSIINRLIKRIFPDKIVTADFKKQYSKAISIFILFVQSGQVKKRYGKNQILQFLEREGLGKVAEDMRKQRVCQIQGQAQSRKKPIRGTEQQKQKEQQKV